MTITTGIVMAANAAEEGAVADMAVVVVAMAVDLAAEVEGKEEAAEEAEEGEAADKILMPSFFPTCYKNKNGRKLAFKISRRDSERSECGKTRPIR
jgi:hypothetical protein